MRRVPGALVGVGLTLAIVGQETSKTTEVERVFAAGFAKIELLGVCKASEESASCWGPGGEAAPDLEKEFKGAFVGSDNASFPVYYGRKSRVAVFRITNPPHGDSRGMIESSLNSGTGYFSWPNRSNSNNQERIETRSAVLVTKLTESVASVTTQLRRNAPPGPRFPIRVGASFDYLGTKFTVRKIIETKYESAAYSIYGATRWIIKMTAEGERPARFGLNWVALDEDGLVIRVVDRDGRPVVADPNAINIAQYGPQAQLNPPKLTQSRFSGGGGGVPQDADDYTIYSSIDPKFIKVAQGFGSTSERIVIKGIPLDPKTP